jgi:hypothetical protein
MLKLHHMNLLKQIQESTLMMNRFQYQNMEQQRDSRQPASADTLKGKDTLNPKLSGPIFGSSQLPQKGVRINNSAISDCSSAQFQFQEHLMHGLKADDISCNNIVASDSVHSGAPKRKNDQKQLRSTQSNVRHKRQNKNNSG